MTDAEKEIREALERVDDASETTGETTWYRVSELRAACGDAMLEGDRVFIAACSPANVRELLDEIERLRGLIDAHNADCIARCEAMSKQAGHAGVCIHYTNRGRTCPNCPRDEMIDAARGNE